MHVQLQYILLLLYMNLHVQYLCCLFHIFKCENRYSIIHMQSVTKNF